MEPVQIEGGDILANLEDRTITGRLIPFGEEGRTNLGRFMVEAGSIELPTDPSVVSLNLDHERSQNVGRATRIWEQPDGVYATWSIARTPAGDAALADAVSPSGRRRRLSGEFGPAVIHAGKLLAGHAALWGSALVPLGAFPSAMVLAADTPETTPATTATTTEGESPVTEIAQAVAEPTTTETPAVVLAAAPAVPPTQTPPTQTAPRVNHNPAARDVFASIAALRANPQDTAARDVLAALADIKISGNGSLPTGANGTPSIIQPTWVGELYDGVDYVREYITLGKLGTDISVEGKKGFTLHRRSATTGTTELTLADANAIANWAGNKAELSGYSGFTQTKQSTRRNFALGNDVAREWFDLPGGAPYVEAFLRLLIEHYYYWTDTYAAADWITAAGTPIAPATSDYDSSYPATMGMVIQGILAVKARKGANERRDVPTFAILNEVAYADLAYAAGGSENLPAFVDFRVSTDSEGTADRVQLVQGNTGIEDTASVIVGARPAIEFDELPGGPLQINALDLAHGGIDRAVHGYLQTFSVRPEAVVLVGTADV
jgi:hypothetical protein